MSFQSTGADAYGSFMGPYAQQLAVLLARHADVGGSQRALDVGSGPGALTEVLVSRLGAEAVCAVEPSPTFVAPGRPGRDPRQRVGRRRARVSPGGEMLSAGRNMLSAPVARP